jgi:hypothetical protein
MAMRFCGNVYVCVTTATPCSSFAHIATVDIAIAARLVAKLPGANNGAVPIAGTSRVLKEDSITATVSDSTANGADRPA